MTINFCFVLKCMLPLFCTGVRSTQSTRIQEISCWENIEAGHSRWHLSNKMLFLLLFASNSHNLCGVYDIKTPFGLKAENVVYKINAWKWSSNIAWPRHDHAIVKSFFFISHFLIPVLNRLLVQYNNHMYHIESSERYTPLKLNYFCEVYIQSVFIQPCLKQDWCRRECLAFTPLDGYLFNWINSGTTGPILMFSMFDWNFIFCSLCKSSMQKKLECNIQVKNKIEWENIILFGPCYKIHGQLCHTYNTNVVFNVYCIWRTCALYKFLQQRYYTCISTHVIYV